MKTTDITSITSNKDRSHPAAAEDLDRIVHLAVRVPEWARRGINVKAGREGTSQQKLVLDALLFAYPEIARPEIKR